jgi:hypothetical protein
MALDEFLLGEVEKARALLEALENEVYDARAAFHQSVRRLHGAGASMREIAAALAMSHQRVHQIIGEDGIVEVEASATDVTPHPASPAATPDACSFCGTPRHQLEKLFGAPGRVFICDACLLRAQTNRTTFDVAAECTFCRRPSSIGFAEGTTFICDGCMSTCARIMQKADDEPKRTAMRRRSGVLRCSFCNASQAQVKKLIAGPGVYICGLCVDAAREVASTGEPAPGPRQVGLRAAVREPHPCGFCGKRTPTVGAIVKGGRTRICDECIDLCVQIISAETTV